MEEPPQLIVRYEFDEGAGDVVKDNSGRGEALNLKVEGSEGVTWVAGGGLAVSGERVALRSEGPATKLIEALRATHELTIEAVLTPANVTQGGPSRIVSLSQDSAVRNVTLGQGAADYVLRLRTSTTNTQGTPEVNTEQAALKAERQHIVATFGAGEARLYVNGEQRGQAKREGDFSNWAADYPFLLANEGTLDRQWRGTLHLVAVYDRALSSAEVKKHYAATTR